MLFIINIFQVKDFWPGQQQFANNLLGSGNENTTITPLVADKNGSTNVGVSSVPHGPNVAKVNVFYISFLHLASVMFYI